MTKWPYTEPKAPFNFS